MKDTWEAQRRVIRANVVVGCWDNALIAAYLELLVWEGNGIEALQYLDRLIEMLAGWCSEELPTIHQMTRAVVLGGRASERAAAVARALNVYRLVNKTHTMPYLVELAQTLLKRGKPPELLMVTEALLQLGHSPASYENQPALIGAIEPLARLGKWEEVAKIRREIVLIPQRPPASCGFKHLIALLSSLQRVGQAREVATLMEATLTEIHAQGPYWGTVEENLKWLVGLAPFAQDRGNQQRLQVLAEAIRQQGETPNHNLGPSVRYYGATALLLSGRTAQALEWMQGSDNAFYGPLFCWLHAATLLQRRQGQALARLTKANLEELRRYHRDRDLAVPLARLGDVLLQLGDETLARRVVSESLGSLKYDRFSSVPTELMFLLGTLLPRLGILNEGLALFDNPYFQQGVLHGLRRCGKDRAREALALSASRETLSAFRSCCEALIGNWQAAQVTATALPNAEPRLGAYVFLLHEHLRQTNATFRKDGPTGEPPWPSLDPFFKTEHYW